MGRRHLVIDYYSPALTDRLARFYDLINQNLTDKEAEAKIRELIREAKNDPRTSDRRDQTR